MAPSIDDIEAEVGVTADGGGGDIDIWVWIVLGCGGLGACLGVCLLIGAARKKKKKKKKGRMGLRQTGGRQRRASEETLYQNAIRPAQRPLGGDSKGRRGSAGRATGLRMAALSRKDSTSSSMKSMLSFSSPSFSEESPRSPHETSTKSMGPATASPRSTAVRSGRSSKAPGATSLNSSTDGEFFGITQVRHNLESSKSRHDLMVIAL